MSAPAASHRLDDRYGRRPRRGLGRLVAVVFGVVLVAGTVFVGVRFADQPVRAETVSYEHLDDARIALTFRITARPGTAVSCTVEALDATRGQVGFTEVDVPAHTAAQSLESVEIATQGPAVSAQVVGCSEV